MSHATAHPSDASQFQLAEKIVLLLEEKDPRHRARLYHDVGAGTDLVQALKDEVDRLKDANGTQALVAGERAFELSRLLAEPLAEALGSWALALGLTVQGRFDEALPNFEYARLRYAEQEQPEQAARVAIRQVQALAMTGDYESALVLIAGARDTFLGAGLEREAGLAFNNTGAIYTRQSHFDKAEWAFRMALEQLDLADDPIGQAQTHVNLGYVCQELDRFREAHDHLEKALEMFKQLDMEQSVAGTSLDLALLFRREGHLDAVLELLSRARLHFDRLGAQNDAALAQLEGVRIHLELNLLDEAEALAEELVAVFGQSDMRLEALEASSLLGSIQAQAGKSAEALEALERSREGWITMGNSIRAARVELQLAALYLRFAREGEGDYNCLRPRTGSQRHRHLEQRRQPLWPRAWPYHSGEAAHPRGGRTRSQAEAVGSRRDCGRAGVPDLTIETKRLLGARRRGREIPRRLR